MLSNPYDDYYEKFDKGYEEPYQPDPYFLQAKEDIRALYEKSKSSVFYMRQLQVKFENQYFHWITHHAVTSLTKESYLKQENVSARIGKRETSFHFFVHHTNRYPKREINKIASLVTELSQEHIMKSCGNRAELLFAAGLASRGFIPVITKARSYKTKKWTKTGHDLDYIFEKDHFAYGCEIKNTLPYIDKDELSIKLEMCDKLRLRPLFIMRYAPKVYINEIIDNGGFALIFKAQIYDVSQKELVKRIRQILGYEADYPSAIPTGIIDRFEKWHNKKAKK